MICIYIACEFYVKRGQTYPASRGFQEARKRRERRCEPFAAVYDHPRKGRKLAPTDQFDACQHHLLKRSQNLFPKHQSLRFAVNILRSFWRNGWEHSARARQTEFQCLRFYRRYHSQMRFVIH